MSAYISLLTPLGGYLFTDGAAYDDAGVVRDIVRKVECAKTVPFAITTLGNQLVGEHFKPGLCEMADRYGVDAMIEAGLPQLLDDLRSAEKWREVTAGRGAACIHMVGYSETRGVTHFNFQTMDENDDGDLIGAYELRIIDKPYAARGAIVGVSADGIREQARGENVDGYVRYVGKELMERMRATKGRSMHQNGTDATSYHSVGGHIDLTIVDNSGARTERIHVWDDKIGKKIQPEQLPATIAPFTGMNRQQRRAAERAQRKSA
jgi:hypothetical protein